MLTNLFKTENIQNSNYRYYFANNYAFILGGFTHVLFLPIFYYLNLKILALYNIFSVIVFILSFILNRKGFHTISVILVSIEIMLHATLATYFIGWETGFFYPSLAIIPIVFSNPVITKPQKAIITILTLCFYLSLKYFSNVHVPLVPLGKDMVENLYFMNIFFIIIGMSALTNYFTLASEITEHKIDKGRINANIANQAKSTFLANMSHELRTPLNAIIGYSEMLKDDADDLGHEQNSKDLAKINSAGNHLLNLINSILDLTKIESGKIELEYKTVNIESLINDVVSTINPMVLKEQNTLIVNCPENIEDACLDQTRLKQILLNILSNACKFTKTGSIELDVFHENINHNTWLCFRISDTGIGIAEDKIDLLFKPFIQADISTTRLYGGTGLGLTISKHFVTLMKGSVYVESTEGKGTTFTIKLPIYNNKCST